MTHDLTPVEQAERSIDFERDPSSYKHITIECDGAVAWLKLKIQEDGGLRPGYALKVNSYDLGVDLELSDAVQRMRFEHPEVTCVVVTSALEGAFSAGANIFMLGTATHGFKVNFCKYTNETRLYIEDATDHSGQTYVCAVNGVGSGGGYELPLACKEIYLIDDKRSAVALPEVPYLGVLPGTGGLTRVVDKRKVRRDRADIFCTLAEGLKGKRAVQWGIVDASWPPSKFNDEVTKRAKEIAGAGRPDRKGIEITPLQPQVSETEVVYRHVKMTFGPVHRTATIEVTVPDSVPEIPASPRELGADWFGFRVWREIDDAILRLRFNYPDVGLVLWKTRGPQATMLKLDADLLAHKDDWFIHEVIHFIKRVNKRVDLTAKSFFALIDRDSCFAGSLFELALGADRAYMLEDDGVQVQLSGMNAGPLPMSNGLTRLQSRFLAEPGRVEEALGHGKPFDAKDAEDAGIITLAYDDLDWDEDVRLAIEERVSLSPDSLTGMEASLRFAGPETMETKIFGRLSAWQNWIFQRPNAVGEKGALKLYGRPESPEFDWRRT